MVKGSVTPNPIPIVDKKKKNENAKRNIMKL